MHSDLVLEYRYFDELTSTNDYLRGVEPLADITVASVEFQTQGRGQMGNTWYSDRGQNLLFSILLTPHNLKASDGFVLSQAMALSIKDVLEGILPDISVKWPNDIYCKGEKICGTLIENTLFGKFVGRSIIGSGVNVNQKSFPDGLAAPATSISLHSGVEMSIPTLLEGIMERFSQYYKEIQGGEYNRIRKLYHDSMYLRGQLCCFSDSEGEFFGRISHVESDGHLIILDEAGVQRRYAFKEVKLIRN